MTAPHVCSTRRAGLRDAPAARAKEGCRTPLRRRRSIPLCFPVLVDHSGLQQPTLTMAAQSPHQAPALPLGEGHLSPSCLSRPGPQASPSLQGGMARAAAQPGVCWASLSHDAVVEAALLTQHCSIFAALPWTSGREYLPCQKIQSGSWTNCAAFSRTESCVGSLTSPQRSWAYFA